VHQPARSGGWKKRVAIKSLAIPEMNFEIVGPPAASQCTYNNARLLDRLVGVAKAALDGVLTEFAGFASTA
jgi:hypothetical protein